MKILFAFVLVILTSFWGFAQQLPTNAPIVVRDTITVSTNGTLIAPTNFFNANSARMNAEVSSGGSSPITNVISGAHLSGVTNAGLKTVTLTTDATTASTANTLVLRDTNTNINATIVTAPNLIGAATSATNVTGVVAVANGGTGTNSARAAGTNIGIMQMSPIGGSSDPWLDMMNATPSFEGQLGLSYNGAKSPFIWYAGGTVKGSNSGGWGYPVSFPGGIGAIGPPYQQWKDLPNVPTSGASYLDINFMMGPANSTFNFVTNTGGTKQDYLSVNCGNPFSGGTAILVRSAMTNVIHGGGSNNIIGVSADGVTNYLPQFGEFFGQISDAFPYYPPGSTNVIRFSQQGPSGQIIHDDYSMPFAISINAQRTGDLVDGLIPLLILDPHNINTGSPLFMGFNYTAATPDNVNVWDVRQTNFHYALAVDGNHGHAYVTNGDAAISASNVFLTGGIITQGNGAAFGTSAVAVNTLNGSVVHNAYNSNEVWTFGYGDTRVGFWAFFGQPTKLAHDSVTPLVITASDHNDLYATKQTGSQIDELKFYTTHNAEFFFPLAVDGVLTALSETVTNNLSASNITATGATGFIGVGGSLTGLNASQVTTGTLPYSVLPSGVITNNQATSWATTNAGGTNGIIFNGGTNLIDFRKGATSIASLGSNGDLRIGGTANMVGNMVVGGNVNGNSWSADSVGNLDAASYSLASFVSMVGTGAGVLRIDDFNSGSDFNQISFGAASSGTGAGMFFAKNPATITFKASDGAGTENVNVTGTIVIGASTNVASFTTVFTNFIDGGTYTNATGRNIFVWTPCTFTPGTGVAGQATYAIKVGGVIKSVYSSGTLATSLAMPETNAVSYLVTNSGVFIFTNLSSGTGSSAAILPGGYYEVH